MTIQSRIPAIVLFGYGNPGRGDDGVGPALIEAMQDYFADNNRTDVECLTDMQLQIEHVTDLVDRERILFIDADISCKDACSLHPLPAKKDDSYTTHAMNPAAVIYTYQQVYGSPAPPAYLLSIRTYTFELGDDICAEAAQNLSLAIKMAKAFCEKSYDLPTA